MTASNNELTTFQFISTVTALLENGQCPPLMVWGRTGVGKSGVIRQVVQDVSDSNSHWEPGQDAAVAGSLEVINNWGLIDLRVSLLEPNDILGLPDLKGSVVRWVVPDQLPVLGQEHRFPSRGILFLDELTHAQPAMQSACFSLVLDRCCGPHRLLPGWNIMTASNSADENAQVFPMSAPLRNRFAHFTIRCSLDCYKRWALANGVDPRVIAFLNWNPASLHQPTDNPEGSFPTPRSWTAASRLLSACPAEQLGPVIAACVGPGTATMFVAFLELNAASDLSVDIGQLLGGKARPPKLAMEAPDVAWALTGRISGAVQEAPERLAAAIKFYCTPAWKNVLEIGRTGLADLKYLAKPAEFNHAFALHAEPCHKQYGEILT